MSKKSATDGAEFQQDETYIAKAQEYDSYRAKAPGWNAMKDPLDVCAGARVLDLGCGSGAFFRELLAKNPSTLDGCDPCEEMVKVAQDRIDSGSLRHDNSDVEPRIWAGDTRHIADASYDVILSAQVLQNLTSNVNESKSIRNAFLREIYRLLAPGGTVVLSTRHRKPGARYGDLYWYADPDVCPKAVEFMEAVVPADPVKELLDAGFDEADLIVSPDTIIRRDCYLRADLIQDSAFRAGDSFFSRLDEGELNAVIANIERRTQDGSLESYISERELLRGGIGQVAVLVAVRTS